MAKLSAHGVELARIDVTTPQDGPKYDGDTVHTNRVVYSVRSDGHILRRTLAQGIHGGSDEWHDFGWKLWKRVAKTHAHTTADHLIAIWTRERDSGARFDRATIKITDQRAEVARWNAYTDTDPSK
jgi:hypothetical protein